MVKSWLVLDVVSGVYHSLNGMPFYFESYEWAKLSADWCDRYYNCKRFEVIEMEIKVNVKSN
jgi:hypothetical protein